MRIIRELRVLIFFEYLFGLSFFTVKWKSNILYTPRLSIFIQIILMLFCIHSLYMYFNMTIPPNFSHAEELLMIFRIIIVHITSTIVLLETVWKHNHHKKFWFHINEIENIFSKELNTPIKYTKFCNRCLLILFLLILYFIVQAICVRSYYNRAAKHHVVLTVLSIAIIHFKYLYHNFYASLILMHSKVMNRMIENHFKEDEVFSVQEMRKFSKILHRFYYNLFCATKSLNDSTNYSLLCFVVHNFQNVLIAVYFSIMAVYFQTNPYYNSLTLFSFFTICLSLLAIYSKIIVGKMFKNEVLINFLCKYISLRAFTFLVSFCRLNGFR